MQPLLELELERSPHASFYHANEPHLQLGRDSPDLVRVDPMKVCVSDVSPMYTPENTLLPFC